MTYPDAPSSPLHCRWPAAKEMCLRLARERITETRQADLGEMQPAELILLVDLMTRTAEDLLELCGALCPDGHSAS